MADLKVCFYNNGTRFKRGTILCHLAEILEKRGILCTFGDKDLEPDVYIFEKVWHKTRYKKPVIIHAENLIGEEARRSHCYDRGEAIVFNSEWLRRVYRNTYGTELKNARVIPPGHQMHEAGERNDTDISKEQNIVCISKWWKRPYKRFPLIARAFDFLNRELGYTNAKLHVLGWLTDRPMPYVDTHPKLWKLPDNSNIDYYHKSFHGDSCKRIMSKAHMAVHLSAIDSGPQVIVEAISQGIPVVITNNMGAAEWIREIGPKGGIVMELDRISADHNDIKWITPPDLISGDNLYEKTLHIARLPFYYHSFNKTCSDTSAYRQVAYAMKKVLDNYSLYHFRPPKKYTMDGIADQWLEVIESVIR